MKHQVFTARLMLYFAAYAIFIQCMICEGVSSILQDMIGNAVNPENSTSVGTADTPLGAGCAADFVLLQRQGVLRKSIFKVLEPSEVESTVQIAREVIEGPLAVEQRGTQLQSMDLVQDLVGTSETQLTESMTEICIMETVEIVTVTEEIIETIEVETETVQSQEMMDVVARKQLEDMRLELEALKQTVLEEKKHRELNTQTLHDLRQMFKGFEKNVVDVTKRMVMDESTNILKQTVTEVTELLEQTLSVAHETVIINHTIIEKETQVKVIGKEIKTIVETVDSGLRDEVALNSKKASWLKQQLEAMEKQVAEMESKKGGDKTPPEVEKSLVELRKIVLELKESTHVAETERSKNIEDISKIKEELTQVTAITNKMMTEIKENKEASEMVDKELRGELSKISKSTKAIHIRIETQTTRLEKEIIQVQDRLLVSETKIIETSREVQTMKIEMQKMQEILVKIKEQQSETTTTNTYVEKVTKEVESRVETMVVNAVERYIEKTQESTTTVIKTMTESMEVLHEKMEKEHLLMKIAESDVANIKTELEKLSEREANATESMQNEIVETRKALERETIKRKESQLLVERISKSVTELESHVKKESERVTVLVQQTKELFVKIEVNSEKIKILEQKSETTVETFRNLTDRIVVLEKQVDEERQQSNETSTQLKDLSELLREVDARSKNNHKMILEILKREENVTKEEFVHVIEKLKERTSVLESKQLDSHTETVRIIEQYLREQSTHIQEKVKEMVITSIKEVKNNCCNSETTLTTTQVSLTFFSSTIRMTTTTMTTTTTTTTITATTTATTATTTTTTSTTITTTTTTTTTVMILSTLMRKCTESLKDKCGNVSNITLHCHFFDYFYSSGWVSSHKLRVRSLIQSVCYIWIL
eukprot:gnl/MRDRNA2_/MRDRNA2_122811_c0_seq1.p1 gnl/MRDRNA2_/MRDRNA2_122811_c0~~gnl/MRDRNA2_/MRDRNA2_122811_c0_seq1.p1  ORF type:complete len:888 (+),score=218.55 gnl/MRDRNA2_/MRDRNA2_122811_c0_seq1:106-2769(+)